MTTSARADTGPSKLADGDADIRLLGGGRLRMQRGRDRADFCFLRPPPESDLVHPYLAPAAALAQIWAGAEAFHAGSLAAGAGAVLLLGGKGSGKSTTLAWLASQGVPVVADDLAVVVDGAVLAGPRCVDLRRSDALDTEVPPDAYPVRSWERLRVPLAAVAAATPIAGTVALEWGETVALREVPARDRVGEILRQRMFGALIPGDLEAILELASRPMLTLTRPRGRAGLRAAGTALVRYFG